MIAFDIPDMTCAHCKSTVEKAIRSVDGKAGVGIDLTAKTADVETAARAEEIAGAIKAAGYTPALRTCL
ncbi:heavy-metal-associated domain-containing protein [Rhizobium sp. 9140]|uniref:heavy-metal-associated domain-containing protein n=1 Tax=Rhizobium sp. 9140 TaxID=1761900 RepID=UPI000B8858DC|nr:heavy-metal-associated domain-containing protein [Rhizobium sp. 9140]